MGEEERRENIEHNIRELETLGWFGFSGVSNEIVKGLVEGEDISFIWEKDEVRVEIGEKSYKKETEKDETPDPPQNPPDHDPTSQPPKDC